MFFSKKWDFDWNWFVKSDVSPKTKMTRMVHTNHFYEISLQIVKWPKNQVLDEQSFFKKNAMSKISENWLFGQKKSPCGVVPQQNKGCKHIPDHSRPNSDQILSKNSYFYSKFVENREFRQKSLKNLKLLRKPCYVCAHRRSVDAKR